MTQINNEHSHTYFLPYVSSLYATLIWSALLTMYVVTSRYSCAHAEPVEIVVIDNNKSRLIGILREYLAFVMSLILSHLPRLNRSMESDEFVSMLPRNLPVSLGSK